MLERGRLLDRIGEHDAAFASFTAGKALSRKLSGLGYLAEQAQGQAGRAGRNGFGVFQPFHHGMFCGFDLETAARHFVLVSDLVAHDRAEMVLHYLPVRSEDSRFGLCGSRFVVRAGGFFISNKARLIKVID